MNLARQCQALLLMDHFSLSYSDSLETDSEMETCKQEFYRGVLERGGQDWAGGEAGPCLSGSSGELWGWGDAD